MSDSSTALSALSREYLTIAHNLANANTAGYKRRIGIFAEVGPTAGAGAAPAAGGGAGGSAAGVREQEFLDLSQGRLVQTGRTLDVALQGPGFLVVETDHGERYTRNGIFRTDAQGRLVDAQQRAVAGEGGPITLPPTVSANAIAIAEDGRLSAGGAQIGKLRIVEFDRPEALRPVGDNVLEAPEDVQPAAATKTTAHQGFQEASNVTPVNELVALIRVTRLYEANVRTLQERGEWGKELMRVAMS